MPPFIPPLAAALRDAEYVLAFVGAGLSASSGIPTFAQFGLWQGRDYRSVANPAAFEADPGLVWAFHEEMRLRALNAQPNAGHHALARLTKSKPGMFVITQNIDGLEKKVRHPAAQLAAIHGQLSEIVCSSEDCTYTRRNEGPQPLVSVVEHTTPADGEADKPRLSPPDLGHLRCPACGFLLRPGVIWTGEPLNESAFDRLDDWLQMAPRVDFVLIIGSTAQVSSSFMAEAQSKGAIAVHFNLQRDEATFGPEYDWLVQGDAAETLPRLVDEIIGDHEDSLGRGPW